MPSYVMLFIWLASFIYKTRKAKRLNGHNMAILFMQDSNLYFMRFTTPLAVSLVQDPSRVEPATASSAAGGLTMLVQIPLCVPHLAQIAFGALNRLVQHLVGHDEVGGELAPPVQVDPADHVLGAVHPRVPGGESGTDIGSQRVQRGEPRGVLGSQVGML